VRKFFSPHSRRVIVKLINKIVLIGLTIIVSVFSTSGYAQASEERMVIYASHPTKLVDYFVNKFKEKYGSIEVDLITGGTGELLGRVQAEKNRPQGDIMFGGGSFTGGSAPELFFTV
jgi:iron(III) transport system substrate-binding protein